MLAGIGVLCFDHAEAGAAIRATVELDDVVMFASLLMVVRAIANDDGCLVVEVESPAKIWVGCAHDGTAHGTKSLMGRGHDVTYDMSEVITESGILHLPCDSSIQPPMMPSLMVEIVVVRKWV